MIAEHSQNTHNAQSHNQPFTLHWSTFEYLKPLDIQVQQMAVVRSAFKTLSDTIETMLPPGADKTYVLRHLRETSMWANIALTRHADGHPRAEASCPAE